MIILFYKEHYPYENIKYDQLFSLSIGMAMMMLVNEILRYFNNIIFFLIFIEFI